MIALRKISEVTEKVRKWNPIKEAPEEPISYVDLSSVDKDLKKINDELVSIVNGSEAPSRARQRVQKNDVLVSTVRPNLNGVAIVEKEYLNATASTGYSVLRCNPDCFYKYLYFWTLTPTFVDDMTSKASGASYPAVSDKIIKESKIPLPPLNQQKKIAAILDAADAYRQKTKALIAKYDELTQSLFLDMFGDPVTNPKGWEKKQADNYIDLLTGFAFKSKDYSDNPEHIRLCGGLIIMPWGIEWNKCNLWHPDKSAGLDKYWLNGGDIVIAMDRPWISTGFKINMLRDDDIPALLVQRTARIRAININKIFLFHLYLSAAFERHAKPTETTVPHISPKDIRSYELIIPPIQLQNQFADSVQTIEAQKTQAQESLAKAEDLFNSLLQRAFKGELI